MNENAVMTKKRLLSSVATLGLLISTAAPGSAGSGTVSSTPVRIASADGTSLAGMVIVPDDAVAGVVLLPGSGPALSADLEPMARRLAARGVAALAFDKRGCGSSEGSWVAASLADLAADAIAALESLAAIAALDGRPLGLWGHSQGVWVATVAASGSDRVAFLVGVSGGGLPPRETEMYQYGMRLDHAGLSAAEKSQGLELVERYFEYLETGEGREAIAQALEAGEPWSEALGLERVLVSGRNRSNWSWVATFDPRPIASSLRIPILLVFGGNDHLIPLEGTIAAWTDSLTRAGNTEFDIEVFPEAGHGIRIGDEHHEAGSGWAPGYPEVVGEWIRARSGGAD